MAWRAITAESASLATENGDLRAVDGGPDDGEDKPEQ